MNNKQVLCVNYVVIVITVYYNIILTEKQNIVNNFVVAARTAHGRH